MGKNVTSVTLGSLELNRTTEGLVIQASTLPLGVHDQAPRVVFLGRSPLHWA